MPMVLSLQLTIAAYDFNVRKVDRNTLQLLLPGPDPRTEF